MNMEFFIGDSIVYEDPFQTDRQQAENLYLTDMDTMESYAYGYSNTNDSLDSQSTDSQFETATYENPDVMNWSGQDCVDWALRVCFAHSFDPNLINITDFRNLTGESLVNYTQYDFCTFLDVSYGTVFYQEFRDLLERSGIAPHSPAPGSLSCAPDNDFQPLADPEIADLSMEMPIDIESFERFLAEQSQNFEMQFENFQYPVIQDGPLVIKSELDCEDYSYNDNLLHEVPQSPQSDVSYPLSPQSDVLFHPSPESPESPESLLSVGGDVLGKIKTTSRKRVRGPKNWEYLMRMLVDPTYNPSVIRWEDESVFSFRIVKPAVVAQKWGQRSNKPNLTYDNFARGLRYHYTTGALEAVSERQLVYRCGPKAQEYLRKELHFRAAP